MEYIHFRGEFADVPLAMMQETFDRDYPGIFKTLNAADFAADVVQETGLSFSCNKLHSHQRLSTDHSQADQCISAMADYLGQTS